MAQVFCMEKKSWWLLHSGVFAVTLILILVTLFVPWFSYDNTNDDDYNTLYGYYDGDETRTWGDSISDLEDLPSSDATDDQIDIAKGIQAGTMVYLIFSIIAILAYIGGIVILVLDYLGKFSKTIWSVVAVSVAFVFYIVGYIVVMITAKIEFGDGEAVPYSADSDGTNVEQEAAGAEIGAILGLISVILAGVAEILHSLVWYMSNKSAKTDQAAAQK